MLAENVFNPSEYPTSINFRTSSLAAALADQTLQDAAMSMESMSEAELRRTGIIISNQYGVQEVDKASGGKLSLIKQMNHILPA